MNKYIEQITNYILSKTSKRKLLGVEIEHFIVDQNYNSVYYFDQCSRPGIQTILQKLKVYYDKAIYANGKPHILELHRQNASITLEPGAQLEVALKAYQSIDQIEKAYCEVIREIQEILSPYHYKILNLGYRPDACALEVPIIPKNRYVCMDARFKSTGTHGTCMMRGSASAQISIDFCSEQDCMNKLKIATCLSPLLYFLYDNSPVFEKTRIDSNIKITPSGFRVPAKMARYCIWSNLDPDRTSSLPLIFSKNASIKSYVEAIIKIPIIYTRSSMKNFSNEKFYVNIDDDRFHGPYSTFDILDENAQLNDAEINQILTINFFDARLKQLIELRSADSMPKEYILSYCALIKGLFYNAKSFDKLLQMFNCCSFQDYVDAGQKLYKYGWDAEVYSYCARDLFNEIINIATNGLNACELKYLKPTIELIDNQICLCQKLAKNYLDLLSNASFKPISKTHKYTEIQKKSFEANKGFLSNRAKIYDNHLKSKSIYNNKIVRMGYFAKVYDKYAVMQFHDICMTLYKIMCKCLKKYFSDANFKKMFSFDEFEKDLICTNSGYIDKLPMARFDIFYDDITGKFSLCEINTGGSAAMSEVSILSSEILYAHPFKHLKDVLEKENKSIHSWDLYTPWVNAFVDIFDSWQKRQQKRKAEQNSKPNFAIIDMLDNCNFVDFEMFKKCFLSQGHNIKIVDIRDLHYDDKALYDNDGYRIDAIYKRITMDDIRTIKDQKGTQAFISAVKNKDVCSIDWFDSQIVHDKQINFVIFDKSAFKLLTPSEQKFVSMHIPFSFKLTSDKNVIDKCMDLKNQIIIKPTSSRGAKSVFYGVDFSVLEWKEILIKCAKNGDFIVQKYCKQYRSWNLTIDAYNKQDTLNSCGAHSLKKFSNMEGLFCYRGKFSGIFLRQGQENINDEKHNNMTTTTFYAKEIK